MSDFIVESALLTHGLKSITNEEIQNAWDADWQIAWMEHGTVIVNGADRFCEFREKASDFKRINYFNFDAAVREKASGALTASGTMRVCERMGIPLVVTAGIGGLTAGQGAESSNDLRALHMSEVSMIATAFKDMFDTAYTVKQARDCGVRVSLASSSWTEGYLFSGTEVDNCNLETAFAEEKILEIEMEKQLNVCGRRLLPHALYLNPIPEEARLKDRTIWEESLRYGREQERIGKYFHPSVNAKLDELTNGYASKIQLDSLIQNIRLAQSF